MKVRISNSTVTSALEVTAFGFGLSPGATYVADVIRTMVLRMTIWFIRKTVT